MGLLGETSATARRAVGLACIVGTTFTACNSPPGMTSRGGGAGTGGAGSAGQSAAGTTSMGEGSPGAGGAAAGIGGEEAPKLDGGAGAAPTTDGDAGTSSAPSADAQAEVAAPLDAGAGEPLRALSIAVGGWYACALLENHRVKCWGGSGAGALGYGDSLNRGNSPDEMGDALPFVDLGTGRTVTAVAASRDHTCAILDDGSLKCWGEGPALGLADTSNRGDAPGQMGDALPALAFGAGRTVRQVAAGYDWSCALLDDDSVDCWGDKDLNDATASHMLPTPIALGGMGTAKVRTIAAGGKGAFVLLDDGTLLGELPGRGLAWGSNVASFSGARQSRCELFVGGGALCRDAAGGEPPDTVRDLVAVGVREDYGSCGLTAAGVARCWSFQATSATYWTDGARLDDRGAVQVIGPPPLQALASGGAQHMCGLDAHGRVWCWGGGGAALGASVRTNVASGAWTPIDLGTRR
jgi:hypothetical protein